MERDETTTAAERANRKLRTDPAKELGRNARGENHELASGQDRYSVETVTPGNATAGRTLRVGGVGSRLVVTSTLNGVRRLFGVKSPCFLEQSCDQFMHRAHNAPKAWSQNNPAKMQSQASGGENSGNLAFAATQANLAGNNPLPAIELGPDRNSSAIIHR